MQGGKQAVILAPTTVLVEQHFRTLVRRMAEYPFTIARLSRFCSTREQNRIVKGLAAGTIDSDYRGEVSVIVQNGGQEPFVLRRGDRVAQLVVAPVVPVAPAHRPGRGAVHARRRAA